MPAFQIARVTALPDPLEANTVYLVSTGAETMEMYVTGNTAGARRILHQADIQAMIDASISASGVIEVVDDIAARDALSLSANAQVFVIDASADLTVDSGGATYLYRQSNDSFIKISEAEGLDLGIAWANISDGPTSTPAAIDAAIANAHTHPNRTQLDKVGENAGGDITYAGREYVRSGSADW